MASLASPKDLILPYILDFKKELERREGIKNYRARLMVVGGHLHDPEFIKIIESQGGLVVADRLCTGSIPGLKKIEINGESPYKTMAEYSFKKTLCPRMMEDFDRRLSTIIDTVKEYKVDGVAIEVIKFCDLWGIDAMPLVTALRKRAYPCSSWSGNTALGRRPAAYPGTGFYREHGEIMCMIRVTFVNDQ